MQTSNASDNRKNRPCAQALANCKIKFRKATRSVCDILSRKSAPQPPPASIIQHSTPETSRGAPPPIVMPAIDYSKWDLRFQSSSDEERSSRTPIPPAVTATAGDYPARSRWPTPTAHVQSASATRSASETRKILYKFVREHPCPSEKNSPTTGLRQHERYAEKTAPEQQLTFGWVMKDMGWHSEHLAWFHYPSFRELWEAAALPTAEAFPTQRTAGSNLYERGGKECMQFNLYALQHAMCGEDFHTDAPLPAYSYAKRLEHVWDGIGSWRA